MHLSIAQRSIVLLVFVLAVPGSCMLLAVPVAVVQAATGIEDFSDETESVIALVAFAFSVLIAGFVARVVSRGFRRSSTKDVAPSSTISRVLDSPGRPEQHLSRPSRPAGTTDCPPDEASSHPPPTATVSPAPCPPSPTILSPTADLPIGFAITQAAATAALAKAVRLDSIDFILPFFVHRVLCTVRCSGTWSCQEQLADKAAYQQVYQQYQFALQQWKANVASYNSQIARNEGTGDFIASRVLAGSKPKPPSESDFRKQETRTGHYDVVLEHRDILSGIDRFMLPTPTSDSIASCLRNPSIYKCLEAEAKRLTGSNVAIEDANTHGLWYPDDTVSTAHVAARYKDRLDSLVESQVIKQAPKHRANLKWAPPQPIASRITTDVEERACPLWIVRFRRGRKVRYAIVSGATGAVRL